MIKIPYYVILGAKYNIPEVVWPEEIAPAIP
jgi:hypothetical protein